MKNFFERLKVCYHVLTKQNYIYFGVVKDPFIESDDGLRVSAKKLAMYENTDKLKYNSLLWAAVEDFAGKWKLKYSG